MLYSPDSVVSLQVSLPVIFQIMYPVNVLAMQYTLERGWLSWSPSSTTVTLDKLLNRRRRMELIIVSTSGSYFVSGPEVIQPVYNQQVFNKWMSTGCQAHCFTGVMWRWVKTWSWPCNEMEDRKKDKVSARRRYRPTSSKIRGKVTFNQKKLEISSWRGNDSR